MMYLFLRHRLPAVMVALFLLLSCQRDTDPRREITAYVEEAERHFESKNSSALKKMIAEEYGDERDLSRQEIVRILAGFFLRRQHVHVMVKTPQLAVADDGMSARLTVLAAISAEALAEGDIRLLEAEIYSLEASLRKDKDWQLHSARLRHATAEDFLSAAE